MMFVYALAFACGIGSHTTYFNRGEHHMYGARYVQCLVVSYVSSAVTFMYIGEWAWQRAIFPTSSLLTCFLGGLYLSLCLYRLFINPLRHFPGPVAARLSDLFFSVSCRRQDAFQQVLRYHERYGNFVRVGSNTLSIAHPKAVQAIYGHGSKCRKADWYDLTWPMVSMQTLRQREAHDRRRRTWSTAFGDKALRGYETRISTFQDQLLTYIKAFKGQPLDVSKCFNLYSFDVMGDLAFGRSFEMLESSQEHWAVKLLNEGIKPLAYMLPIWLFRLLVSIPGLTRDWWNFIAFCRQRVEERMKTDPLVPDVMSALLQSSGKATPDKEEMQLLHGDSQLVVVAGSDTTSTTLTHVLYELAKNPEHLQFLREEIASNRSANRPFPQHQDLQHLAHLNGVINETLRLHPPVPTALQRLTPPEGLLIAGSFIPGNTVVWCPQYAIGRNEEAYVNARAFIPERWTTRPEMVKQQGAFAPFSTGPYGCIGRPLALLNLRTTLARLLLSFDFAFAPGEQGAGIEGGTTEHFTLAPGPLLVTFRDRP